ncbi:MAG TPA: ABC transporter permease [Thermomicrobiales bacterium]|jgi:peptide/nickel transport system permease protein|nr:ABC transporter permease [Thermomicrobiales bacterium]
MSQEAKLTPGQISQPAPASNRTPRLSDANSRDELMKARKQRTLWGDAWMRFRKHKLAMLGLILFVGMILITFIGNALYGRPYDSVFEYDSSVGPNPDNLLGTNSLGQDLLAQILWGGRISLAVGILAATIAILLGTAIGAIAGFFGGLTDTILMRITDIFLSLPQLPLLLLITYLFSPSLQQWSSERFGSVNVGVFLLIIIVISAFNWMTTARLVRASFLATKERDFVEAAHSIGAKRSSLMLKHIMPNVLSPIIVAATLAIGTAIITESSLSFLGLGFPPGIPTWGSMLFNARQYLQTSPHESLIPGFFIFLTVLSINYVGDGLRDALDPRRTK